MHGVVLPVSSAEEKKDAFRMIVDQIAPGRWEASRQPDEEELRGTGVLRVKVETARRVLHHYRLDEILFICATYAVPRSALAHLKTRKRCTKLASMFNSLNSLVLIIDRT